MADDNTWSEKSKQSSRGKRPPKDSVDADGFVDGDAVSTPSKRSDTGSSVVRTRSDDGAKKVAKAAATAGQRDVSFQSRLGFPALVGLICLLGIGVVFYAWSTRDGISRPTQADHWHAAYGVYDCTSPDENKYLAPFQSAADETGIHSHGDGLIHIHPFFELSSGDRAQMNHFFNEMGIEVTPEAITLDTGAELVAGTECADGSGPAEITIAHWDFDFQATADDPPKPQIFTDNFRDIKFENDREIYIIAFAAAGTELPQLPPERFVQLDNTSAQREWSGTDDEGNLIPNDTGVTVEGETEDGEPITGTDAVDGDDATSTEDDG